MSPIVLSSPLDPSFIVYIMNFVFVFIFLLHVILFADESTDETIPNGDDSDILSAAGKFIHRPLAQP